MVVQYYTILCNNGAILVMIKLICCLIQTKICLVYRVIRAFGMYRMYNQSINSIGSVNQMSVLNDTVFLSFISNNPITGSFIWQNTYKIHMSHFAYACKMRYPLNLVLESWEYLWFYWTFCIVYYGLKLHKLSNHTLVMLQKWLEIH